MADLGEASEAYDRAIANSLADRGVDTERAVRIATEELSIRRDAYTLDSAAWALFRNGQPREAVEPIEEALASGIRDARVLYHAGEIFAALSETERARTHLEAALDVNRSFDVLGGRRAVALLEDLR